MANDRDLEEKLVDNQKKWTITLLKSACSLFGLAKSGTREELCKRVAEFLHKPYSTGVTKRSSTSSKKGNPKKRKAKVSLKKDGTPRKRRAPSAFILFSVQCREELKSQDPELSFKEIAQAVSERWSNLDDDEKQVRP